MQLAFTRSNSNCRLAAKTSFTPFFANAIAVCSPMPLEAPVINTTFPWRVPKIKIKSILYLV